MGLQSKTIFIKRTKFEWTIDNIRVEKIISAPISATIFFWRVQFYYMLNTVPSCNLLKCQKNIMIQPWENGKNPNFGPSFGPWRFFHGFYQYWYLSSYHPMQFPEKLMGRTQKKKKRQKNLILDLSFTSNSRDCFKLSSNAIIKEN